MNTNLSTYQASVDIGLVNKLSYDMNSEILVLYSSKILLP